MKQEKHIDQYIKEKLENYPVVFDDKYWHEAEKLIIAQEKKKRRGFFFWLFFLLLGSVTAAFSFLLFKSDDASIPKYSSIQNKESKLIGSTINENNETKQYVQVNSKSNVNSIFNKKKNKKKYDAKNYIKNINTSYPENSDSSNILSSSLDSFALLEIPTKEAYLFSNPNEYNLLLDDEENLKRKFKKNYLLGINAGLTLNNNFNPGLFAGLHLQRMSSSKFFTRVGLQFSTLAYDKVLYNYKKIDYSFGENEVNYTVKSNTLYTIQVPISFHYRVYKSNFINLGMAYTQYFAQENEVVKNDDGEISKSKEYGASRDFNKHNLALLAGYETKIWRKYQIGISSQYSLMKPVSNSLKINSNDNKPIIESRIYLIYHFIKLK